MNTKVVINCDGICCENKFEVEAPEGWETTYAEYGGESDLVFCFDCLLQCKWFRSICPGCVGGFPDCGLAKAFMYDNSPGLNSSNVNDIESGRCPFRVNGTLSFSSEEGIKSIDLSKRAPSETGIAMVNVIQAYADKYSNADN